MKLSFTFFIGFSFLFFSACTQEQDVKKLDRFSAQQLHLWNKKLTDVIIKDIFTPPVASRIYVYPNIAAYEVLIHTDPAYKTLAGQLQGLKDLPSPDKNKRYYLPAASIIAFSTVAKQLVFAREDIESYEAEYLKAIEKVGINEEELTNSLAYGRTLGNQILAWVKKDGYLERTALSRYLLLNEPGKWQPTAPGYMPAIEPHWYKMRTLALDSCAQFKPSVPTAFDTLPNSTFFKESQEVYHVVKNLSPEQLEIAKFWDCNPNVSYTKGHVMFFHQKISPGGHWMSITSTVSKNKGLDMMQTSEAFTRVALSIYDGFISCWDEKYRSNVMRPETYIEKYIDPSWDPILQTPPFPEYPSGHSVISSAAAATLTNLFGDNVSYMDSTEVEFGLPARKFTSFYQASEEAAISRLYGGIHFRPAIENGSLQGRKLGQFIVNKIKTRVEQEGASQEIAHTE
jgi:hypothetical protein